MRLPFPVSGRFLPASAGLRPPLLSQEVPVQLKKARRNTWIFIAFLLLAGVLHLIDSGPINPFASTLLFSTYSAIYAGLLLSWMLSLPMRLLPSQSRVYIFTASIFMLLFLAIRIFKYRMAVPGGSTDRYSWYAYYVPFIYTPTFFLMSAVRFYRKTAGRPDERLLAIPATAIVVLVLTNDLHGLAFTPKPGFESQFSDTGEFIRGPLYFTAFFWFGATVVASVIFLLLASWRLRDRRRAARPFLYFILWIVMVAADNVLTHEGLRSMYNAPEVHIFCLLGIFEACIRNRLMPCNENYPGFFARMRIPAVITDNRLRLAYRTAEPLEATAEQLEASLHGPVHPNPDTLLSGRPIPAGFVFWETDESTLRRLHDDLERANETLAMENELLRYENEQKEERIRIDTRNRLYARAAAEVYTAQKRLEALLERAVPGTPAFRDTMARACLLNSYVKRRANFVLLAEERDVITGEELCAALRESALCLSYCGIEATVSSDDGADIPYEEITAVFETYELLAESLIHHASYLWIGLSSSSLTLIADRIPEKLPPTPVAVTVRPATDQFTLLIPRKGGASA